MLSDASLLFELTDARHLRSPSGSLSRQTSTTLTRPSTIATSSCHCCPRRTAKSLVTWPLPAGMSRPALRRSSTCSGSPASTTGSGSLVCPCRRVRCTTNSCWAGKFSLRSGWTCTWFGHRAGCSSSRYRGSSWCPSSGRNISPAQMAAASMAEIMLSAAPQENANAEAYDNVRSGSSTPTPPFSRMRAISSSLKTGIWFHKR